MNTGIKETLTGWKVRIFWFVKWIIIPAVIAASVAIGLPYLWNMIPLLSEYPNLRLVTAYVITFSALGALLYIYLGRVERR